MKSASRPHVIAHACLMMMGALLASSSLAAGIVSIAVAQANLRDGPSVRHEILYELGRDYPLKVLGQRGAWLQVRDFEGDVGWLHRKLIRRTPTLIVKHDSANLRSGPGTRYRVVARLDYGEVMQRIERRGRWVKIRLPDRRGLTGWVARSLLWGG